MGIGQTCYDDSFHSDPHGNRQTSGLLTQQTLIRFCRHVDYFFYTSVIYPLILQ